MNIAAYIVVVTLAADPDPTGAAAPAPPAAPDELGSLRVELAETAERALIVERKLELIEEAQAKKDAEAAVVAAGEKGFNFKSADGAFVVKVRGLIHADGRELLGDQQTRLRDTFVVRRARPLLEATFMDLADFRLMPDFGNGQALVQDAYVDLKPFPWLKLRGGKFKGPVGLERLQSASAIVFPERGFPTVLAPNRDVGFMLHGAFGPSPTVTLLNYELGVFNGVVDGGSGNLDNNHVKDWAGRLFATPFKGDPYGLFANLGVGVAGSLGDQRGTAAVFQQSGSTLKRITASSPGLPAFRTAGQQTFFSYLLNDDAPDASVIGRGSRTRISPQAFYYYEHFGLLGEYIQSSQRVEKGAASATLTHRAWQVAGTYVFGGKPLFEGVTVTAPFNPKAGTWGALELAVRYNALTLDKDTFPTFADAGKSVKKARAFAAVANWHWNKNLKLSLAFEHTTFDGGAAGGADRVAEKVLFQRIQASF